MKRKKYKFLLTPRSEELVTALTQLNGHKVYFRGKKGKSLSPMHVKRDKDGDIIFKLK